MKKQYNNYTEVITDLKSGKTSCVELVDFYLNQIETTKELNAFLEVWPEEARARAAQIDAKIAEGKGGRLAGMVIGIKDNLLYTGHTVQAGSKILEGYKATFTATALQRLLDADAIFIGRQNCDEFAMGSSTESSYFGPSRNADNPNLVPGGSSGGSAVATQANLCHASIGSDTGGSVRQPASYCGVVGLKPTYGRISRWGLIAYGSSFDCIGPITRSVYDAALLLEIMAGPDSHDSTVSQQPVEAYAQIQNATANKYKIAYLKDGLHNEIVDADIRHEMTERIEFLKGEGHDVEGIDFPLLDYVLPTYYILSTAEASSNLSRYDGARYGFRHPDAKNVEEMYKLTRSAGFGTEVKRRIMLGTFVLSASYYDAFYTKAQKVRRLIRDNMDELFEKYDFLVLPTAPSPPFKFGAKSKNPIEMYLEDLFTVHANVAGVPAISVPIGHDRNNLAIGFQIMAPHFQEAKLLELAEYISRN